MRSLVIETCGRLGDCDCAGVPSCCSGALASDPCLLLSCRGMCGARASCLSHLEVPLSLDSHVKVRLTESASETETETGVLGALPAACHPRCVAFVS